MPASHSADPTRPPTPWNPRRTLALVAYVIYQVGSALGLAVITSVATSCGADQLANAADQRLAGRLGVAAVAVAGALAAVALLRTQRGGGTHSSDDLDATREEALAA
jgi:hypothetical protein